MKQQVLLRKLSQSNGTMQVETNHFISRHHFYTVFSMFSFKPFAGTVSYIPAREYPSNTDEKHEDLNLCCLKLPKTAKLRRSFWGKLREMH